MDKQKISDTIKNNPEVPFEVQRDQAKKAGISVDDFSNIWDEINSPKYIKYVLAGLGVLFPLLLLTDGGGRLYFLINPFSLVFNAVWEGIVPFCYEMSKGLCVVISNIVFSVVIYFLFGMWVEELLKEGKKKKIFMQIMTPIFIIMILISIGLFFIASNLPWT